MNRTFPPAALTLAAAMLLAAGGGGATAAAQGVAPPEPEFVIDEGEVPRLGAPVEEPLGRGRVVAVDPAKRRVVLDVRPTFPVLPEGGLQAFHVEDASELEGLGPGDKVRFEVERDGRNFLLRRLENSN